MYSFQEFDTLLETAFNDFQTEESSPYLSTKNIHEEITQKNKILISLDQLDKLEKKLQLTPLEKNIILTLFAPEINNKYSRIYAYIQDDINLNYPTVHLLNKLFCSNREETQMLYDYFISPSKLLLLQLICFKDEDVLLFSQPLRLSPSLRNYLLGDIYLKGTLPSYCKLYEPQKKQNTTLDIETIIEKGLNHEQRHIIHLYGNSEEIRRKRALELSSYFNLGLLSIYTEELIRDKKTLNTIISQLIRDALLTGTLLYFENFDLYLENNDNDEFSLLSQLQSLAWITIFSSNSKWSPSKIPKKQNFSSYTIEKKHTEKNFEAVILPQKQKELLQEIMIHYKYQKQVFLEWGYEQFFQSQGISILFSGVSGTGKTLTASILAQNLGLELYKIDLSKMVSKYIGETEKHLEKLFKKASSSQLILFFDEADAIFGKRTEVNESHDRYANMEVSYLLQKIEEYNGIVILATNFKKNIDSAFLRRLRFAIDFPTPNAEQREKLWEKLLPLHLLEKPINFRILSQRFKLSGANIRNIGLYSAFWAASQQKKITFNHILKALKSELNKVGILYSQEDFEELKEE